MKRYLMIGGIILAIALVSYGYFNLNYEIPRLDGKKYEQEITKNVKKLFQAYTQVDSTVYLIKSELDAKDAHLIGSEKERESLLKNGGKFIYISKSAVMFGNDDSPSEIYAIIRIMLYLKDNPINIKGITCLYYTGVFDSIVQYQTSISYETFNELYNKFYNPKLSDKENTKILADMWMEKTKYVKGKSGSVVGY